MRLHDAALGGLLLGLAAWIWWLTGFFPAFPGQDYGPSLFPRVLGSGIALCGALLLLRGLREGGPVLQVEEWARDPVRLLSFLAVPGAVLLYILLSDWVGFIPLAFVLLLGLTLWFRARPVVALPVAAGVTLAVHWFFAGMMRVPLPRGWLDAVL
ncbi:tripartite tricarboxylate transporter TctB family protein [Sabulicella glaciei]|uniref:Tripartite tricarboxylate transporter TctB family protein n=1 Tax=Sabulicella glaciei TaxID=2984948 RepID=A0ABT3NZ97_9PROT|nr:tripartite tricarboxylate transporter TctB family protein [Roseococcus sp. MDT2-1-1]MCW8087480.1 tripartite tricarboxylate transporter TctB family protein [Roseococcus sp. MDT2-1-1]